MIRMPIFQFHRRLKTFIRCIRMRLGIPEEGEEGETEETIGRLKVY